MKYVKIMIINNLEIIIMTVFIVIYLTFYFSLVLDCSMTLKNMNLIIKYEFYK